MKRILASSLGWTALSWLALGIALAQPANHEVPLEGLTQDAHHIFVGRVVDVRGEWGTNGFGDRIIYSNVQVQVTEMIKGWLGGTEVTLRAEGGRVGDDIFANSHSPTFKVGDEAVLFTRTTWIRTRKGLSLIGGIGGKLEISPQGIILKRNVPLMELKREIVQFVPLQLRATDLKLDRPVEFRGPVR